MAVVLENSTSIRATGGGVALDFDVGEISNGIILIGIGFRNLSSNFTPSITDNLGSFSLLTSIENGTNVRVEIWAQLNPVAGTHGITVYGTSPTSVPRGISFALFSGVDLSEVLQTDTITGNGNEASVFVENQIIDGLVFDVMASMRPTAVSRLYPTMSTQILNVGVTGAMVASQATQAGQVDTVGWLLSTAKEWAIAAVNLKPYIPAPPPGIVVGVRQTLSTALVSVLGAISSLHGQVYEYSPGELTAFPTAAVVPTFLEDTIVSNIENIRRYGFNVIVYVERGKTGWGTAKAELMRRKMEDDVLTALSSSQQIGEAIWQRPENAGWGISSDGRVAFLIINVVANVRTYIV